MAGPPSHFFKFIPPGFKFDLSIPSSFLTNLSLGSCSNVKLRRGRHEWSVDIDDGVFGEGWRRFVRENGVQEFDFIVFKHQGNMVFDFLVFDQSTCERQSPNLFDEMDVEEPLTESDTTCTHTSTNCTTKCLLKGPKNPKKRKRDDYASQNQENFQAKTESGSTLIKKETTSTFANHPYFISTLKPCSIKKSIMYIPVRFSMSNGLKVGEMILRDDKGRSWRVQVNKKDEKYAYIGRGLRAFSVANGLKKGDAFKFELVKNEKDKPPIVNFSLLKSKLLRSYHKQIKPDKKAKSAGKEDSTPCEEDGRPYFKGELKLYSIQRSYLYLPQRFATSDGIINKQQMILKNGGRAWAVKIHNHKNKFYYIGEGWKDFCVANGLKEGDHFKFELADKGKYPIVNFFYFQKIH